MSQLAFAGGIQFNAYVEKESDRQSDPFADKNSRRTLQISADEAVTLKILIKSDNSTMPGTPRFKAPGFEVVNQSSSISVSTQFDLNSGQYVMQNIQQISKVLRPLEKGNLKISDIQLTVGDKTLRSPDISIEVLPSGSIAPSQQSSGGSNPSQLTPRRGQTQNSGTNIVVRAEVDKERAYKGEQIVVSYYIYHQPKIFNLQVDKFPILNGFLREDLDVPVMNQRLEPEEALLNGIPYQRSLLVRYAAFPLQEGKLDIDSISVKYNYYVNLRNGGDEEEDPFFGFFQQLAPRAGGGESAKNGIEVLPLPLAGRPSSFTGGVGNFNLTFALDKYEVHANEAVTLTIKVDGHGNLATLPLPKTHWPEGLEVYDSKSRSQTGAGGLGEKIFEFLLIPRVPGKLTLPPVEFGFFDPKKKLYYTKNTESISLNVLEPLAGTSLIPQKPSNKGEPQSTSNGSSKVDEPRYLKTPGEESDRHTYPIWKYLYSAFVASALFLFGLILRDIIKKNKKTWQSRGINKVPFDLKKWQDLSEKVRSSSSAISGLEIKANYEALTELLLDSLEFFLKCGVRSHSRNELKMLFVHQVEKSLKAQSGVFELEASDKLWNRIEHLLEFTDLVRFSNVSGADSETQVRDDLEKWISEGETLAKRLAALSS